MFRYLLRNPICQEMGRKFKIAFSSTEEDTAFTFIHDIGFIPKIKKTSTGEERGFKTVIGGGLGSNPHAAVVAHEFLPTDQIIPFTESLLRVFDRYGERNRRMKARFKFLLKELGVEEVLSLVEKERNALPNSSYPIDDTNMPNRSIPDSVYDAVAEIDPEYQLWKATNVIEQKQSGYYGVYIKLPLGDLSSKKAHQFADVIDQFASNELRITVNQGYLLRYINASALPHLFIALKKLGLAAPGFDSVADITSCPGTDSCNLGISNSTSISLALEKVVEEEFPELVHNLDIKIKISGCPNSCGQHGLAGIGFHGSSIKDPNGNVLPALMVLLGGGRLKDGDGIISEKIIKVPSKRGPDALRLLLNDYELNANEGEYYHQFYVRQGGRKYYYDLLKPLADVTNTLPQEYIDWGGEDKYKLETAVGECAGVIIDLVSTLFLESGLDAGARQVGAAVAGDHHRAGHGRPSAEGPPGPLPSRRWHRPERPVPRMGLSRRSPAVSCSPLDRPKRARAGRRRGARRDPTCGLPRAHEPCLRPPVAAPVGDRGTRARERGDLPLQPPVARW
jgi:sulfite reductase (ferredoxin)